MQRRAQRTSVFVRASCLTHGMEIRTTRQDRTTIPQLVLQVVIAPQH